MFLIERLSNKMGYKIARTLKLDRESEEVIVYGAFNLLQILCSILWVVLFGIVFNILIEVLVIFCTISLLRKYSGGVHASSPGRCIIVGTTVTVVLGLIIHNLYFIFNLYYTVFFIVTSMIFSYCIVHKLAPVDSDVKPITKVETRKRFKRKSIIILIILYIIMFANLIFYLIYGDYIFLIKGILCVCVGTDWQCFTLTNRGHKVLTKIDNILKKIL